MDAYPTTLDKVALAVEAAKVAKSDAVKLNGIGEDINLNLFGWRDSSLVVIAQMLDSSQIPKDERFAKVVNALCIIRQGWQVDGFTMVAEAFCSLLPSDTRGKDLAAQFAEKDSPVMECLSFTHVSHKDALFVTVPYTCVPPRTVMYKTPLKYSGYEGVLRDRKYPAAMGKALDLPISESVVEDGDTFHAVLAEGLADEGFDVHYL
jgi:hypothetical protein